MRSRSALTDLRFAISPSPEKIQEFKIAKLREERREEAEAMYRMWKEAPEQWLLKSKIGWSTRHESRRAPARRAVAPHAARVLDDPMLELEVRPALLVLERQRRCLVVRVAKLHTGGTRSRRHTKNEAHKK